MDQTPEARWVRRPEDIAFVDDGEDRVAMLDLLRLADPPIVLEGTAAAIWRLLDEPRSLRQVTEALAVRYDADRELVTAGVVDFVDQLRHRGLIVPAPPAGRHDPEPTHDA